MPTKYIFFTGGVVSSVGKGVTAAATGLFVKITRIQGDCPKIGPLYQC